MTARIWAFAIYWGVWLVVPVLIDGLSALVSLVRVWMARRRKKVEDGPPVTDWPGVTIIIPVYNGQETLGGCLQSIRRQNYPPEQIEVLVVDNGSTDDTAAVFQAEQLHHFRGQMHWISISGRGKSYAINAGLHLATFSYICNLDADTVMHPDALREMVRQFEANPRLGAATGAIQVLPVPMEQQGANPLKYIIAECEFLEYLEAFWLGRQGETITQSLFTLAGAFSFFRRRVLFDTLLYDKQTVSEDTKLTFDIRQQFGGERIACIPESIVYVTPTPSLAALYSQRVRWQRGQLEVAGVNNQAANLNVFRWQGLALGRILLVDHTFIFPRLVWTFLFPALYFFGYPLSLVISATIVMYLFYILLATISTAAIYVIAPPEIKARLEYNWWIVAILPLYRFLVFVFRLAGSIITLAEPAGWSTIAPWIETINALRSLWSQIRFALSNRKSKIVN